MRPGRTTLRRLPPGLADAEAFEERFECEGAAVARIDGLDLKARDGRCGLRKVEAAAASHEAAGHGVALVVGEPQAADHQAVLELPLLDDLLVHVCLSNMLGEDVHERLVNVFDDAVVVGGHVQVDVRNPS